MRDPRGFFFMPPTRARLPGLEKIGNKLLDVVDGTLRMTFTDGLSSPTASPKDMVLESALIKAIGGTVGTIPFEVAAPLEHTFTNFARSTCLRHVRTVA